MSTLKVNALQDTSGNNLSRILQIKQTAKTDTFSETVGNGAFSSVCISCAFAATSSSSKLLIRAVLHANSADQPTQNGFAFTDDGSFIAASTGDAFGSQGRVSGSYGQVVTNEFTFPIIQEYLHTISDTNSHTYGVKLYSGSGFSNTTMFLNFSNTDTSATNRVRPMSTLTIIEIAP
tara:strand:+ start:31 stop:561 length:531 start_codon:yes stop_codon:yes gene_type:complete